jgi:hypothetical protein
MPRQLGLRRARQQGSSSQQQRTMLPKMKVSKMATPVRTTAMARASALDGSQWLSRYFDHTLQRSRAGEGRCGLGRFAGQVAVAQGADK